MDCTAGMAPLSTKVLPGGTEEPTTEVGKISQLKQRWIRITLSTHHSSWSNPIWSSHKCTGFILLTSKQKFRHGIQGNTSPGEPGLGWLWFGMFNYLAQLLSQFCQFSISPGRTRQRWNSQNQSQPNSGLPGDVSPWGALYKKLRFVNVRNVGTNLGVGTFTWIFMV